MELLFADTETTGTEDRDRIIQVAFKDDTVTEEALYKAEVPIGFRAMAEHHITNEMVEDKPPFQGSENWKWMRESNDDGAIFVAHNAPFDLGMLEKDEVTFDKAIDTLKVVKFLDSEAKFECYKLQYLRYLFGIKIEATAHDALGDVLVLEQVFWKLLKRLRKVEGLSKSKAIRRMMQISNEPLLVHRFQFGKFKGELVADVAEREPGYLHWLQTEKLKDPDGEEDWLYTLEHYLGS